MPWSFYPKPKNPVITEYTVAVLNSQGKHLEKQVTPKNNIERSMLKAFDRIYTILTNKIIELQQLIDTKNKAAQVARSDHDKLIYNPEPSYRESLSYEGNDLYSMNRMVEYNRAYKEYIIKKNIIAAIPPEEIVTSLSMITFAEDQAKQATNMKTEFTQLIQWLDNGANKQYIISSGAGINNDLNSNSSIIWQLLIVEAENKNLLGTVKFMTQQLHEINMTAGGRRRKNTIKKSNTIRKSKTRRRKHYRHLSKRTKLRQ